MPSDITVRLDDEEVRRYLDTLTEAEITKFLRKASTQAGAAEKRVLLPAIPVGRTGNLRRSVKSRRIRRNPSIGVVVGPMGRLGAHRALVAGGTKPHIIRPSGGHKALRLAFGFAEFVEHPGARPHPFIPPVADRAGDAGVAAAEKVIDKAVT